MNSAVKTSRYFSAFFNNLFSKVILNQTSIVPLVVFRIAFGLMMVAATLRFWLKGWIYELYIKPEFYFSYYGFEWVKPLGNPGMYVLFGVIGLSALCIALGLFYRWATVLFFLTFTYAELIDKSNYLNHYYFVSIIGFLLCFVPANAAYAIDCIRKERVGLIPSWTINIFKLQLALVYFFAGIAKINYDWLFRAMPLAIWLPAKSDMPVVGFLFDYQWVAYLFSWAGMIFDLSIPFLLWWNKSRSIAYVFVVVFHLLTWLLFPIGMFPFVMIVSTLIFFDFMAPTKTHIQVVPSPLGRDRVGLLSFLSLILSAHFIIQLLLPLRYLCYPGKLFWTEQGYRFSWRVMLIEKMGMAQFTVVDTKTNEKIYISNSQYLTQNQEKMMATQPDMILQYAHFLRDKFKSKNWTDPQVYVESYVVLNGTGSRMYIDPKVNLAAIEESFGNKKWIIPYKEMQ